VVYLPTKGKIADGFYFNVEPVEATPVNDTVAFEGALKRTFERGNPKISMPTREEQSNPVVLGYAKVKTWSAFAKSAQGWSIEERNGVYTIAPYKNATDHKGWVVDTERAESLSPGATIEEVVKRTVERVQSGK